jgi:hypothetical protein
MGRISEPSSELNETCTTKEKPSPEIESTFALLKFMANVHSCVPENPPRRKN